MFTNYKHLDCSDLQNTNQSIKYMELSDVSHV
jgi:hypothetical protein